MWGALIKGILFFFRHILSSLLPLVLSLAPSHSLLHLITLLSINIVNKYTEHIFNFLIKKKGEESEREKKICSTLIRQPHTYDIHTAAATSEAKHMTNELNGKTNVSTVDACTVVQTIEQLYGVCSVFTYNNTIIINDMKR